MPSKKRRRLSQETIPVPSYVPTMTKHRLQKHGISKIQQMYKSQSRVSNMRQVQHQETSIMPPPRTTIKTLAPVKQRIDASPTKMQHVVPSTSTDIPMDIITSPQKQHPVTVAKVLQSTSSPVPKNLIKISQNQTQSHQKLVIVSASQTIATNMSTNKLINTLKLKPEELQVTDSGKSPKLLASQVIVSKSQLMPIQSLNEKQKVVTVQAKVRPQGSIIVPLQGQNTSSTSQFAGVSVPVLQGVQWKAIQGKSTVKLLPLSGNAKIIQNKGVGSGPIYVMSKQSNMVVNKTTTPMETTVDTKSVSNVTHIRPISQKTAEEVATTTSGKVFVVRKASPVTTAVVSTVSQLAIPTTVVNVEQKEDLSPDGERKSTVLQDALRASGVSPVDDDIESQISQYTVIPKTNTKWSASAAEDPSVSGASSNKTLQNISLQDTKFLTLGTSSFHHVFKSLKYSYNLFSEEAVAILGDNETRALLSNLQVETSSPTTIPTSTPTILDGQLDPTTGVYSPLGSSKSQQMQIIAQQPVVEQLSVIPPTSIVEEHLDIFSSAIASAEIQLENTEYNFEMSQHETTPEEQLAADESNIIETTEVIETTDENCMEIDISPNVPLTDKQLTDILTDGDISSS